MRRDALRLARRIELVQPRDALVAEAAHRVRHALARRHVVERPSEESPVEALRSGRIGGRKINPAKFSVHVRGLRRHLPFPCRCDSFWAPVSIVRHYRAAQDIRHCGLQCVTSGVSPARPKNSVRRRVVLRALRATACHTPRCTVSPRLWGAAGRRVKGQMRAKPYDRLVARRGNEGRLDGGEPR